MILKNFAVNIIVVNRTLLVFSHADWLTERSVKTRIALPSAVSFVGKISKLV